MDNETLGHELLLRARHAIARKLGVVGADPDFGSAPELSQPGATFVTLTLEGRLRGCIGSLEAYRPLAQDVAENALAAALRDPRFPPVSAQEWPGVQVEVSLLTPAEPLPVRDEADALAQLRPGEDGLIFQVGSRRATFLPQVWEQLPSPQQFLAQLKMKAGLAPNFWSPAVQLFRYRVCKWKENRP